MTSTAAWTTETTEKIKFTKLCRLLYDGGTKALRSVFDVQCPPPSLVASLNSNKSTLLTLKKPRGKVLNDDQWDKLYPPPGGASPKSEDFDITLLFVLLRNICPRLAAPLTGWDEPPNTADNSLGANLVRIKVYRNKVIAHSSSADIEETQFTKYWDETSNALVSLGLKKDDIDKLKSSPLGEEDYNRLLKEWAKADEDIKSQLESIKSDTAAIKRTLEEISNEKEIKVRRDSPINKLVFSDFSSVVKKLVGSYHPNTRQWIFEEVRSYLERESSKSIMVVIEAGPGMGKSVVAAKICDMYKKSEGQRIVKGACYFFKHNNALRNDPSKMLQSIARQLCVSVPGYEDALERNIQPTADKIPQLGCRELFTLLLEEPCSKVNSEDTVVVVIDALDECNNMKNELCKALVEGIPHLPSWIRFVITTRPPPSISSFRTNSHIYIKPEDANNKKDLKGFIEDKLKDLKQDSSTVTADHIKHLVDTTE
ncbi:uncharacterized protein LOC110236806, partial [Exaiptasia diaphana]|uniref:NACHT domain-containing protein n=1 Tax=Exaiptasia diaphana TaxID=2652724 RepID=A0A913YI58_EXADI